MVYRIWFSDEMGFNIQTARKKIWTNQEIYHHEKLENKRLNVWAAFSAIGKSSLDIYEAEYPFLSTDSRQAFC